MWLIVIIIFGSKLSMFWQRPDTDLCCFACSSSARDPGCAWAAAPPRADPGCARLCRRTPDVRRTTTQTSDVRCRWPMRLRRWCCCSPPALLPVPIGRRRLGPRTPMCRRCRGRGPVATCASDAPISRRCRRSTSCGSSTGTCATKQEERYSVTVDVR